ncbi:mannitol dehydrogenase family protein [Brevibacterium marinum]|uniref:Fructuronate reductase n=1 Tax=Brevibacterium marinum TaxID=418643 RepID=A0A846RP37_9MICO|nr:mannitol dehydrogenase family protein [Brevibacterium marinum]NJC55509.1 fructuronate reductase [Brevibacterium marinum]
MSLALDSDSFDRFDEFSAAGFRVPQFDPRVMRKATTAAPTWVHLGAGNFFRSVHAIVAQAMLDGGHETGIVLANLRDHTVVENSRRTDDLFVNVVMNADGTIDPALIASVAESAQLASDAATGWDRMSAVFRQSSLQLVTLTITEKGYQTVDASGEALPEIADDVDCGPARNRTAIPALASLLLTRFHAGGTPIALMSTDNFSDNGDRLAQAVRSIADLWVASGQAPAEFADYVSDRQRVAYPSTMVDRITPSPSPAVAAMLAERGLIGADVRERSGGGPLASFSNTESTSYLVVEDDFPNGRPPFELAGVLVGDRELVSRADRMKVCTCLNPLHTAMAVVGCLLGFTRIAHMMDDCDIRALVEGVGRHEGLPVADTPSGLDPAAFLAEVIDVRLPNPGLPDSPQRIATDTSQKLGIRFGETIRRHVDVGDAQHLTWIPFAIAAWVRYLLGVDDDLAPFERSPDPLLPAIDNRLKGMRIGDPETASSARDLLADEAIFGVDLVSVGLAPTVEGHLGAMLAGAGAVRRTLHRLADSTRPEHTAKPSAAARSNHS